MYPMRSAWDECERVSGVTADGAAWLASASAGGRARSVLAYWEERPGAPVVLGCGGVFDVVSTSVLFGRRMVDRLWSEGDGSGPVAVCRGRMLLFAAPGTAQRLPSLLAWEEWGGDRGRTAAIPPLLCHGTGDAITVPPITNPKGSGAKGTNPKGDGTAITSNRWLVAPDSRHPWLPGPEVLLWAAVRAARAGVQVSISADADPDAKVYDVSRRR